MSQKFKFKYDEFQENEPNKVEPDKSYPGGSNVRNVCFVQLDGKMTFLNYGYLVSGDYNPIECIVTLFFTSHSITLKGTRLESLYQEFLSHIPKFVECVDVRYSEIDKVSYIVNEIEIIKL